MFSKACGTHHCLGGTEDFLSGTDRCLGGTEDFLGGTHRCLGGTEDFLGGTEDFLGGTNRCLYGTEDFLGGTEDFLSGTDQEITFTGYFLWRFFVSSGVLCNTVEQNVSRSFPRNNFPIHFYSVVLHKNIRSDEAYY